MRNAASSRLTLKLPLTLLLGPNGGYRSSSVRRMFLIGENQFDLKYQKKKKEKKVKYYETVKGAFIEKFFGMKILIEKNISRCKWSHWGLRFSGKDKSRLSLTRLYNLSKKASPANSRQAFRVENILCRVLRWKKSLIDFNTVARWAEPTRRGVSEKIRGPTRALPPPTGLVRNEDVTSRVSHMPCTQNPYWVLTFVPWQTTGCSHKRCHADRQC